MYTIISRAGVDIITGIIIMGIYFIFFCYSRCAAGGPASISWHPLVWAHISKLSPLTPDTPHGAARSSISCDRVLPANAPRFLLHLQPTPPPPGNKPH